MFNIGPSELIIVLLVALLIVGPKRLPDVGKTIGRSLREFRKAQDDIKSSLNFDLDDEPEPMRRLAGQQEGDEPTPSSDAE